MGIRTDKGKSRILEFVVFHSLLVVFLVLFFAKWTPLVVYDSDDWFRSAKIRIPLPQWGGWEPSRVLPEVAMPIFTGRFAARILYPITGDYVWSVTLASAITMSIVILIMCICFHRFLMKRLRCSAVKAFVLEGIFITSFFLVFRNRSESKHLFYSADLCTAYYYTISGIMNAILMLIIFSEDNATEAFWKSWPIKKVLLCVFVYFAMFSNLFHSAITTVFCGMVILLDWIKEKSLVKSLRKNLVQVVIILIWFVVLVFEYSGGRSDSFEQGMDIALSFRQFMALIGAMAIPYKVIVIASVIGFFWLLIARRDVGVLPVVIVSGVLETAFLLLLNAKVHYMSRVEASWGTWFYLILFCVIVGCYVMNYVGDKLLPAVIVLCFMIFFSWYPDGKFAISSTRNSDYAKCYDASTYISSSIIEADKAGETELTLVLPKSDRADEFTFITSIGNTVSDALYRQGVIKNMINVTEVFDESLNDRFLPK